MRLILALGIVTFCLFVGAEVILANDTESELFKDSQVNMVSNNDYEIQSTQYIKNWQLSFHPLSNNQIRISGFTESYTPVDTIGINLILQYLDGGTWRDVQAIGYFSNENSSYISGRRTVELTSGFRYRVRSLHYVVVNGLTEQFNVYSNSTYID